MVTFYLPLILLSFLFCAPKQLQIPADLVISFHSDPLSNDPVFATDIGSIRLNRLIYKNLFRFDLNGNILPELAESYQWHQTNQELTIKLKVLKNQFNQYLKAEDVAFALSRLQTQKGPRKSTANSIMSINVSGKREIKIKTSKGLNHLLILLSMPQAAIYAADSFQNGKLQGWGDYKIIEWNKNNFISLYTNNTHLPKNLLIRILPNASTSIFLIGKKELDVMPLPFFLLNHKVVKENTIRSVKGQSVQYIAINNSNPCFDKNFRQALNLAVNRELAIQHLFYFYADISNGPVPVNFLPNIKNRYSYDPAKAKNLLETSACYPQITGNQLEFRMRSDDINQAVSSVVAQDLKNIGLKIKIVPMEKTSIYRENHEKKGDLTLLSWYLDYNSALNFIDPLFNSSRLGNGGNRSFYQNRKIDNFIQLAQQQGPKFIDSGLKDITETISEDAPWIFLWSIHENYLISVKALQYPALLKLLYE